MRRPPLFVQHVALCPASTRIGAAIFLAALSAFTSGCIGSGTLLSYSGTASLQTGGAAGAIEPTHGTLNIQTCSAVRRSIRQERYSFASLRIGDECTIPGTWVRTTFIAETGGTCVLRTSGEARTIHVTDALARLATFGAHGRFPPEPNEDPTYVEVQIGGDTLEGPEAGGHLVYRFVGALASEADAEQACVAELPPA